MRPFLFVLSLLLATTAAADRGAFTVDAGGGLAVPYVSAPYAPGASSMRVTAPSIWGGVRYALRQNLELSAAGFYETPVRVYHHGVSVLQDGAAYPGVLAHEASRVGALVGGRFVYGYTWRLTLGVDVAWSRSSSTALQAIDVTDPSTPLDYGLVLPDAVQHHLVLAPLAGVEWAAGDHWSVSVLPRVQLLLGPSPSVAVTIPLMLSWSWYL